MSISALLLGVEKRLRSEDVFNDTPGAAVGKFVGVQPDGSPPNNFGQFYCAVHSLGGRALDPNALSDDQSYSVGVTITARLNYSPRDRQGKQLTVTEALYERVDAVIRALHQDDLHRIEANELIVGTAEYVAIHGGTATVNGFECPLKFATATEAQPVPPGWGGVTETKDVFRVAIRFIDAQRCQLLP